MGSVEQSGEEVKGESMNNELIKHVMLPVAGGKIRLRDVMEKLKALSYPTQDGVFMYFSYKDNAYVHGNAENPMETLIPLSELSKPYEPSKPSQPSRRLRLKWRPKLSQSEPNPGAPKEQHKKGHAKRSKERKIGDVVEKVSEWRRLYTGRVGVEGKVDKLSLEDAAKEIGIAKKTLDDYLLQLRAGKKYGFDFNQHKEDKIGVLRAFVKEQKGLKRGQEENGGPRSSFNDYPDGVEGS